MKDKQEKGSISAFAVAVGGGPLRGYIIVLVTVSQSPTSYVVPMNQHVFMNECP